MNTTLDKPPVETVLLETWLEPDLPCRFADGGAAWRWTMTCCGDHADLCDTHDAIGRKDAYRRLTLPNAFQVCGSCGHSFGFAPYFYDVYARNPI